MEQFKVETFLRDTPEGIFPDYKSLGTQECDDIRLSLCSRLSLPTNQSGSELARTINGIQVQLHNVNAEDENFDLQSVLRTVGVSAAGNAYVNWRHFDAIDIIDLDELSKHFHDVWYPSSDDIDLFDSSFSWILSIDHDGRIQFVNTCATIRF